MCKIEAFLTDNIEVINRIILPFLQVIATLVVGWFVVMALANRSYRNKTKDALIKEYFNLLDNYEKFNKAVTAFLSSYINKVVIDTLPEDTKGLLVKAKILEDDAKMLKEQEEVGAIHIAELGDILARIKFLLGEKKHNKKLNKVYINLTDIVFEHTKEDELIEDFKSEISPEEVLELLKVEDLDIVQHKVFMWLTRKYSDAHSYVLQNYTNVIMDYREKFYKVIQRY